MTTDTATSPIFDHAQTSLTLHGPARLALNVGWYALFAAWLFYIVGFWIFSIERIAVAVCRPFASIPLDNLIPNCIGISAIAEILGQGIFLGAAALLFIRKPNELMTVMAAAVLLLLSAGISNITLGLSSYPLTAPISRFLLGGGLWITGVFFLLFPDGRFRPRWTWLIALIHGLWILSWWFVPELDITRDLNLPAYPILAFSMMPSVAAIWIGYRRYYTPTQQQQTKWVIFGVVGALLIYLVFVMTALAVRGSLQGTTTGLVVFVGSIYGRWFALSMIPITILFSIARYRLWDVDLVINRALATGAVTVALILVFIGAVLGVQQLAIRLTGGEQSSLAVAAASLAVAVLFNPIRSRLKTFIDRRFYPRSLEVVRHATMRGKHTMPQAAVSVRDHVVGKSFGQYEIKSLVGRGGMSEVYRGQHKTLDRSVAVKVLTPSLAQDSKFRARFQREGRTVASLHHPNIVTVYDAGEDNGTFYMAMEFIEGENLAAYLKRETKMPHDMAISILRNVASALDYAHDLGIVHRDVKPHNIMLQPIEAHTVEGSNFRPVLMDFGIARLLESHTALTTGSGALGTLDYIAPEQILETSRVDRRADIYSLGVVAYQMLTGKLPFNEDSPAAVIMSHLQKPAPDPRKIDPTIPMRTAFAILRALSKEPEQRQQTAGEFVDSLAAPHLDPTP